jgi:ATP diphosphatase
VQNDRLRELIARLRADCPWDRAQDHLTMRPYLLEEAYEVLDALDAQDATRLREELGDLLFQVYFHARLAEERGEFDIEAVADGIVRKMVERHPHVFGGGGDPSIAGWEARKAARRTGSRVDGVPLALPALLRAHRVGEKLHHVGFDWPDLAGVLAKVDEERAELAEALASGDAAAIRHEYGDLLLACANLGRFLGIAGEDALREANARFEGRFRTVEALAAAAGVKLEEAGLDRLEAWWQEAKKA